MEKETEVIIKGKSTFTELQQEELKDLVKQGIDEYFVAKGKTTKNIIFATALLIGAIAAIVTSLKAIAAGIGLKVILGK